MQFSDISILTPTALYVQLREAENQPSQKQVRTIRPDIAAAELKPGMRALGRHIAHCQEKGRSVRIPAMLASDLGHVLRALELKRAFS